MFNQYGLLGVGSGIAVALYLFSLIEKRTTHGPDPASSIPIPSRADSDGMLPIVFVLEWGVLAIFVLSELLPRDFQTWLKLSAISCWNIDRDTLRALRDVG